MFYRKKWYFGKVFVAEEENQGTTEKDERTQYDKVPSFSEDIPLAKLYKKNSNLIISEYNNSKYENILKNVKSDSMKDTNLIQNLSVSTKEIKIQNPLDKYQRSTIKL